MEIITRVHFFNYGNEGDVCKWRTKIICHFDGDGRVFAATSPRESLSVLAAVWALPSAADSTPACSLGSYAADGARR
ncbi:hypothetical protein L226DRAFT_570860 [Lentinus tigrinus ALCF2SS1-7]|uniref:Uncharacterized protein n=1 Tax=Lentinus tigrinus ALCF2SS1-6 TaxID=1328759 RepID=A0A5C2SIA7_9APHY|nr:hypothetical protein L227DRAFT_610705 [Lentinus tigrinus ALCF2SS1-6]RPD75204.1 hypothetical protein L226DRAFT_570860 [Lentinus tigrinus ALCF2SS1-7]